VITEDLGCPLEQAYPIFEDEPLDSRLAFQSHRAWLQSGELVTVKVVHPELESQLEADAPLLPLLAEVFTGDEWTDVPVQQAISDFHDSLRQQTDFLHEAESLTMLAQDSKEFERVKVPGVHRQLCSSKVLTLEQLSGVRLDELMRFVAQPGDEANNEARELAWRLCLVWLQLALQGRAFAVDPRPENIVVLPTRQIAFTGGGFVGLPSAAKTALLEYLIAVATEDPDKACTCLLSQMSRAGRERISDEQLRLQFRQIVPFRDGGWSLHAGHDSMAERLFVQWRFASAGGYQAQAHLVSFYRGLFQVAAAAQRLAVIGDPLHEGLENLRFWTTMGQFREMIGLSPLGQSLDKYAALMMELPKKLDDALALVAEGHARLRLQVAESPADRRQKNSGATTIALLLVLAAVVLWSQSLRAVAGTWGDRLITVTVVVLGALLVRAIARSK
jgi:predicted unusual protein kinase regulating ubiquinone biosynthesis (AarF/ABC1/UbiB family)